MPVYEYRCDSCEKLQEVIQKFADAPLVDCELCGAKGVLKKQISRSSFSLKGSGWYSTDYKKAKPASAPAPDASSPATAAPATPATAPASTPTATPKTSDSKGSAPA